MQARAGAWPSGTQASHSPFISSNVPMSDSQIVAIRIFVLSLPHSASSPSIWARMARRLAGDVGRGVGDLAREVDGIAVDHGLAHALVRAETGDVAHDGLS